MIGPVQVIEFAGFWPLEGDFLANRIWGFPRIASRDSSRSSWWSGGILRCDHASDGRPVIGVTEEVKFSRAPHGCADYCMGRSRPRQNNEDANSGRPAG